MIKQICQMPILIVNNYLIFNLTNGAGNLELIHIFIKVRPDYSTSKKGSKQYYSENQKFHGKTQRH